MRKFIPKILALFLVAVTAPLAFAHLIPFDQQRIESFGEHCVHGYDGNNRQVGIYYAGDTAALNKSIAHFFETDTEYATKTVTLRVGPMAVPTYVHKGDEIPTNWEVQIWSESVDGVRAKHINVNVWLGGEINLNELNLPTGVTVKSGGEIEGFITAHKAKDGR